MRRTFRYFRDAIRLVWKSAPGWTLANYSVSFIRSFLPLLLVWLLKELIDSITEAAAAPDLTSGSVIWLIISVVIIWFVDEAGSDFGNFIRQKQSMKLEAYMYNLLHNKAVRLDLINFERPEYFDCLSRATREAPWRPNSILNNLISMFRGIISLILMTGVLFYFHWGIALLLIVFNIPGVWLRLHYAEVIYNFQRKQTPESRKAAYFNWLLTGDRPSREIRLFGLGSYFISLFRHSFLKTKEEETEIVKKRSLIELVSDLFKAGAVLITLMMIASETIKGSISLGQMAMFLLAFRQGMVYMKDLFSSLAGLYEDSLFIGDTFEFLDLKEGIVAVPPVIIPQSLKNSIVAENLSFSYPGNKIRAIDNISFHLNKGEIVALAGPNGAGKSTLVKLLCRLYDPDSGTIKYDGYDIRNMDPDLYRKNLSVIFQDFMLYNLNAGENIRLGNIEENDPDEKIVSAAAQSGLDNLIKSLPGGYSAAIGNLFDDSRELSWGEWQKFAISRALFRNAPVLILDEPSSALDADSEFDIFNRIRDIAKGRTTMIISHRLSNISLADRIIVMDKGKIAETGTHDELIKKGGMYSLMYSRQASRYVK